MIDLQGKTVLITGASKGIGRRLSLDLAKQGVNLGLVARSKDELQQVQAEAEKAGAKVLTFNGSVSDESIASSAVEAMLSNFGHIDFFYKQCRLWYFWAYRKLYGKSLVRSA